MRKMELLSPAGDRERLEYAVQYGADAVYMAGKEFGMRSAPANFDGSEMNEAVRFAHAHGTKVFRLSTPASYSLSKCSIMHRSLALRI